MKILIIGGGTIGFITAEYFMREGHDVTVVEQNKAIVKTLQGRLDVNVFEGRATDVHTLEAADIAHCELFLALTDNDEANIISCTLAKFAGVPQKIARLNQRMDSAMTDMKAMESLGVDEIIATEDTLVHEMSKLIEYPGCADIKHFMDHQYMVSMLSFGKSSHHYGKKLSEVPLPETVLPLAYTQVGDIKPYDDTITVNEFLYVYYCLPTGLMPKLHAAIFPESRPIRKAMIYGGGYKSLTTGVDLAHAMEKRGVKDITLVMEDEKTAEMMSTLTSFPVLIGDPSKPYFAKQEQFYSYDAFIALSSNFERDLFSCCIAFAENVPLTIALVRYPEHVSFMSTIPVTSFLNPGLLTANKIMRFHKADTIISRNVLLYNKLECVEFLVRKGSPIEGKLLNALPFKKSKIIVLKRGTEFLTVLPERTLSMDDRVLLFLFDEDKEALKKVL